MDWIEQWFGFTPDNGDGTLELLLMLVVAAVIAVAVVWRLPRARRALLRILQRDFRAPVRSARELNHRRR